MLTIRRLVARAHDTAIRKGFWEGDQYLIPTKLALIHSEISEALEAHRNNLSGAHAIGEELADAVIRIADLSAFLGLDLEAEIQNKLDANENRPYKHGKAY